MTWDVQRLIDQDLLEEGRACSRKYYTVLPAGRELLGQKLKVGPGQEISARKRRIRSV